jgi:hypothetical protein
MTSLLCCSPNALPKSSNRTHTWWWPDVESVVFKLKSSEYMEYQNPWGHLDVLFFLLPSFASTPKRYDVVQMLKTSRTTHDGFHDFAALLLSKLPSENMYKQWTWWCFFCVFERFEILVEMSRWSETRSVPGVSFYSVFLLLLCTRCHLETRNHDHIRTCLCFAGSSVPKARLAGWVD